MFAIVAESAQPSPYPHFRASISLPGVSKHFRICCDCCRTTASASSSRRPWSSPTGEVAMAASPLSATAFGSAAEGDIAFSKPGKSKCCTGVRSKTLCSQVCRSRAIIETPSIEDGGRSFVTPWQNGATRILRKSNVSLCALLMVCHFSTLTK
jgi:hypothetical protein